MQVGTQMRMATDWASLHRERMAGAGSTAGQDAEGIGFGETLERTKGSRMAEHLDGKRKAPYSHLADDSRTINYNGVLFYCDYEKNRLCLGDVSDMKECICVGLSEGGSLVVNRDNLGDLSKAIGMFSPEDVNRIMRAIARDKMCQQKLREIDETKNSLGGAENAGDGKETEKSRSEED